ncbi:MAG: hypothetical protein H6722_21380 [Sandaracinus sp.]|nr:hypothetical protein [Sandaracinus sp.]
MSKLAPFALAFLALGCFRSRSNGGEDGGTRCTIPEGFVCCSARGPEASPPSACPYRCPDRTVLTPLEECVPPMDAGLPPADSAVGYCSPPVPGDHVCLPQQFAPAGRPFQLPVTMDGCGCCPPTGCSVAVDEGRKHLLVHTTVCHEEDVCDCDSCQRPVATCEIPALARGDWTVESLNGGSFALRVEDEISLVPEPPACTTFGEADGCTRAPLENLRPDPVSRICIERNETGRHLARLVNDCGGCAHQGPCVARVRERLTDDLPPGGEIELEPTVYFGDCDGACPPVCIETERECPLPELLPGGYYRVWVDGRPRLSFVEGTEPACGGDVDVFEP